MPISPDLLNMLCTLHADIRVQTHVLAIGLGGVRISASQPFRTFRVHTVFCVLPQCHRSLVLCFICLRLIACVRVSNLPCRNQSACQFSNTIVQTTHASPHGAQGQEHRSGRYSYGSTSSPDPQQDQLDSARLQERDRSRTRDLHLRQGAHPQRRHSRHPD